MTSWDTSVYTVSVTDYHDKGDGPALVFRVTGHLLAIGAQPGDRLVMDPGHPAFLVLYRALPRDPKLILDLLAANQVEAGNQETLAELAKGIDQLLEGWRGLLKAKPVRRRRIPALAFPRPGLHLELLR